MNLPLLTFAYGAVLHVCSLVAVVVLMATGHLDQATGYPLLAALVGFGLGVPLSPAPATVPTPPAPPAPPAAP